MGRGFRLLLSASAVANMGDGISLAAGPLLVASQTRDPLLVSLALFCQYLPTLLFGALAGAIADRTDRRQLMAVANLGRAGVLAVLAGTIATGVVNIGVVLAALFVLGTAEIFADLAASSLLPTLVKREDLGIANARLSSTTQTLNGLVAPPIGAFLFAIGMALPFAANAAAFALAALLVSRLAPALARTVAKDEAPTSLRADIVEGVRWLAGHPPMRTLVLTIIAFNVTFGAAWSVLVLYAGDRLGMDEVGFGFLMTAMAVGGIIGTAAYGRLERRFSLADIMRVGLLIETGTHLVLGLTTLPGVAFATFVLFGAHASIWGTTSSTVRQRAVPHELMGRVGSVHTIGSTVGMLVGTPIGGLLARTYGITAPFWFGFIGSAILVVILWRQFDNIVHAGDHPTDV